MPNHVHLIAVPHGTIYPGNAEETYAYDAVGNLITAIDPTGMQTDTAYDGLNRLLSVTEAGTAIATSTYDGHDNRTEVTDANGKITSFTYDDLGNRLITMAPDTGLTAATYDATGNLLTLTDARNQTIAFGYDALNRPIHQSYPGAARDILFTYNAIGKLSAIQEEESRRTFAYTTLGQLTVETKTLGSTTTTVGYRYNNTTGELASMTYPSGRVLSFSRDTTGRITDLQIDGTPLVSNVQYLPFGPVKSASLGSLTLIRSYDQRYQVNSIQVGSLDYTYTRDQAGQVTGVTNLPSPTTTGITETATYNPDNNRLTGISGGASKTYTYDANGNITSDGISTYSYDALNRLIKVEKSGGILATYGYDSQNRRIRKTIHYHNNKNPHVHKIVGTKTISYHYSRDNLLISETLANGNPLRDYFYLNGEPIAMREYEENPGLYYFINDHLGTPQQLVTSTGTIVWQAAYLPFGKAQVKTATVANNLRFPGQYYDTETGLHYNWNRYYDPEVGRYVSADPIGLDGGMNLYAYVGGNPVNWIDPWGLRPPIDPSRLPPQFRPDSLNKKNVDMIDFRPGGSENVRDIMWKNPGYSEYDLTRPEMTHAGNYNYGYAGAKNGYSLDRLQSIADCDQYLSGKQSCTFCMPKDNPEDAANILEGYNDYKNKKPKGVEW